MFRKLGRQVGGGDLAGLPLGILHVVVVALVIVGGDQCGRMADHHDPGSIGQEQALVRVEHDRVGPLDAVEHSPAVLSQQKEASIGRIHMKPAAFPFGDRRSAIG
jgi:hypothetical protein